MSAEEKEGDEVIGVRDTSVTYKNVVTDYILEKRQMKKLCFGKWSIFRGLDECLETAEIRFLSKIFHRDPVVTVVSVRSGARCRKPEFWSYNVQITLIYSTSNQHVWPEIHSRVAVFNKQPLMFYTVYSVFGNLFYRPYCCDVTCTAVQRLSNAGIISRLMRDEEAGGLPVSISIKRLSLASGMGRRVQVTGPCMLETMLRRIFGGCVEIVPRTEECCSAVYFTIMDVDQFLKNGHDIGFIGDPATSLPCGPLGFLRARVHVYITYIGNAFLRFAWDQEQLLIRYDEVSKTEAFAEGVGSLLITILKFLC
jgi:hypothetical protein